MNLSFKKDLKKVVSRRAVKGGNEVMMGQVKKVLGSQDQGIILMVRG